jgi:hypothetical protein
MRPKSASQVVLSPHSHHSLRLNLCCFHHLPVAAYSVGTNFCALILTSQNGLTFLPSLLRYVLPQEPLYGKIFAGSAIFLLPPLFALFLIRRHLLTGFGMGAVR